MHRVVSNHKQIHSFIVQVLDKLGETFEQPWVISVQRYYKPRSLEQNAKMHAMIGELAKHTGYSNKDIKDYIKAEYGPTRKLLLAGHEKIIPKSTTEYSIQDANEMIEHLYRIGSECGCVYQYD